MKKKVVMTIAGSDSGGGAGIQADIKTFSALGVHGACVIVSVTSQNTTGVKSVFDIPVHSIESQFDAVCSDMTVSYAKTGMLSSSEIVKFVTKKVVENKIMLVVDPVMAAEAGGSLLQKDAVSWLKKTLLPVSYAVTPNVFEAEILSGISIQTPEDALAAAAEIAKTGVKYVVVTGGHLDASDIIYESETGSHFILEGKFIGGGTHGTGCTFSAALISYLSRGYSFVAACRLTKKFVTDSISYSEKIGNGVSPVSQSGLFNLKRERAAVIENILSAYDLLKDNPGFPTLIPEVGSNIAMSVPDIYRNTSDETYYAAGAYPSDSHPFVLCDSDSFGTFLSTGAAFPGRIHKVRDKKGTGWTMSAIGFPVFGSGLHLMKAVDAAQKFDPGIRACINLKYSPLILEASHKAGFSSYMFKREDEPKNYVRKEEWGSVSAISKNNGLVPDIIYDTGGVGKEAIIRVFGTDAVDAALKIKVICEKLEE
ncbi:bifunctional hydroxymethylpyrimidine kinase/phosphomethylpyrimidine kinase [Methanolapillus ohkumae]|uniref:Pyridoxine/pyridoxal/pyridoxamine kinase n=1 Tax=Methanolapillus ohkumae TaxID=3028298 RepID=A0AA96V5C9_9EURY|nr:Pyridoxine/pyridoxal/pyridoxamine kinase [Methanosarcinaceae archaeon Am2]